MAMGEVVCSLGRNGRRTGQDVLCTRQLSRRWVLRDSSLTSSLAGSQHRIGALTILNSDIR